LLNTNLDSARMLAGAAVRLAWRHGQGTGLVYGLNVMSSASYYASDYPAAQRTYELLLWAARRARRPEVLGSAYMGLGNVARGLDDWAGAERYFRRAQRIFASSQPRNGTGELAVLANRAYNYLDIDSTARARALVRQALALLRQFPEAAHPAKVWALKGLVQKQAGQLDSAAISYGQAVGLARTTHDLNPEAEALLGLAGLALRRPDYPLALRYARQAEALFHRLGDQQEAEALKYQAAALHGLGQPGAYAVLHRYTTMYDSIVTAQRAEAVTAAQARFDLADQQARIRVLEREKRIDELEATQRTVRTRVLLGGLAVGGLLLAGAGVGAHRRRQQRRDAALRHQLAADLHDDVGTLLSQIALQTDLLQEGLAPTHEQPALWAGVADNSRMAVRQLNDVVWNLDAHNDTVPNLLDRLRDYAHEVLVPTGRDVRFVVDTPGEPLALPAPMRRHLYSIYKEALHNILKYAPVSATVTVGLLRQGDVLVLEITNDGPVPTEAAEAGRSSGHGLRNIRTRAAALGGSALAAARPTGGFTVRVEVPIG
jgi:signal transduction histidine kinase